MQFASHFTCWGETSFYKYVELFNPDVRDLLHFYGDPRPKARTHSARYLRCTSGEGNTEPFYASSVLNDDPD